MPPALKIYIERKGPRHPAYAAGRASMFDPLFRRVKGGNLLVTFMGYGTAFYCTRREAARQAGCTMSDLKKWIDHGLVRTERRPDADGKFRNFVSFHDVLLLEHAPPHSNGGTAEAAVLALYDRMAPGFESAESLVHAIFDRARRPEVLASLPQGEAEKMTPGFVAGIVGEYC